MQIHGLFPKAVGATALAVAVLLSSSSPAASTPPAAITVVAEATFAPALSFVWSSSGAFDDAGTFEFVQSHWGAIPSPRVGTLQQIMVFTSAAGTFTLRASMQLTLTEVPGFLALDGPWSVLGGTGAYEGLHGAGKVHIDLVPNPELPDVATLTGRVHLD